MAHSLSDKIIRNTVYNSIGRFWGIIVALVLTPYIISRIGIERFGIWSVIGVVTGYFSLLDFGVGMSFVKYIAQFYATRDYDKVNEVMDTGLVFYGVFAIVIIGVAVMFTDPILSFFKIPPALHSDAVFVFRMTVTLFALSNATSPFVALQSGLQRMDISNLLGIASSLLCFAGTFYFLEKGYGLPGLMINNALIFAISTICNVYLALRLFPRWRIAARFISAETFRGLFVFGFRLQVSRLANLISFQADKIIIARFLNLGMVTFYQLGSSLMQNVRQLPLLLVSGLVPAVSEVEALKDRARLETLFVRGSKYLIAVATPLTIFTIADASLIFSVWMGHGYGLAAVVVRMLAIGYYAATVTGAASSITSGVGRTDIEMKFGILMAVLNISLSIGLVMTVGFIGAVLGTMISLFVSSVFFMVLFYNYFGWQYLRPFLKLFMKPLAGSLVAAAISYGANCLVFSLCGNPGRIASFAFLGIQFILFIALYCVFILHGNYIDGADRRLIIARAPFLKDVVGRDAA